MLDGAPGKLKKLQEAAHRVGKERTTHHGAADRRHAGLNPIPMPVFCPFKDVTTHLIAQTGLQTQQETLTICFRALLKTVPSVIFSLHLAPRQEFFHQGYGGFTAL
jgi:hypothetical protein